MDFRRYAFILLTFDQSSLLGSVLNTVVAQNFAPQYECNAVLRDVLEREAN